MLMLVTCLFARFGELIVFLSGLMTGHEVLKKNPAAERGANVVGCNWVLKIVNGTSPALLSSFLGISLVLSVISILKNVIAKQSSVLLFLR